MNSKKILLTIICIGFFAYGKSQNYQLGFTGSGGSSTVSSIEVLNLTQNTTTSLGGNDILVLSNIITGDAQLYFKDQDFKIYPNPSNETVIMEFYNENEGQVNIEVNDIIGKKVLSTSANLEEGTHSFNIYGLNAGIFLINVKTPDGNYSGKIISNQQFDGRTTITHNGSYLRNSNSSRLKNAQNMVEMQYNEGERLLIKGISGNYSRVLTIVPTQNQTVNFEFVSCTDAGNNHYPVVTIGTQTWMAENLKTTKYNDSSNIPLVEDARKWVNLYTPGYCWYNNEEATYKDIYGALYNWYAVHTDKLCPTGWHVPTDTEWTELENYLIANGYNYDGATSGNKIAKSLATATGWDSHTGTGTVGNTDYSDKLNATGFSALPGGYRRFSLGTFEKTGSGGVWWSSTEHIKMFSSTEAYYRKLYFNGVNMYGSYNIKSYGYSVRCLRD